jgi:branched-chain amino acid transport system substrate-binding protein
MAGATLGRRDLLQAGIVSAALGACKSNAPQKAGAKEVVIGYVSPQTGPLAALSECDGFMVERVTRMLDAKRMVLDGAEATFRIVQADSQSNAAHAGEVARTMIGRDRIDLMVVGHTPETTNPVGAVCEAMGIPCVSTLAPIAPWLKGGPYKSTFHFFWDLPEAAKTFEAMWSQVPTNKVVAALWPNDGDGASWASTLAPALEAAGYKVIDAGRYPNGLNDFTSFIQKWKAAGAEILNGVPLPPDWAACWRQCTALGYRPKIATINKAVFSPKMVNALGPKLAEGLSTGIWWSPEFPFKSSINGETARQLADAYPSQWTQLLGFVHALFEVASDALNRAGSTDKDKVIRALADTKLDTMVGPLSFDKDHVGRTPYVGGQWTAGAKQAWDLEIVYDGGLKGLSKKHDLRPLPPIA